MYQSARAQLIKALHSRAQNIVRLVQAQRNSICTVRGKAYELPLLLVQTNLRALRICTVSCQKRMLLADD